MSIAVRPEPQSEGSSLFQAIRVVRERWWIVLGTTAVCVVGALALALTSTKEYEASSTLLFRQSQLANAVEPGAFDAADPERDAATNLLLITSNTVAERVRNRLELDVPADDLAEQVVAEAEPDADLVDITATDTDPALAARIADAFAEEYVAYRRDADRRKVREGQELVRQRIAALPPESRAARSDLGQTLRNLIELEAVTTGDAEVVDRAEPPSAAASPKPRRDAALALVLGLALGLGIAFLVDLLDRRAKSVEDFEALYGIRALTSMPQRSREPSTVRDRAAALEPFRILRNALGFLSVDHPIRVVMISSAVPGEGKTTVGAGLARALALSGQSVVLVEADLRRPTFRQQFQLGEDQRGLTTALVGGVPVRELVRTVVPGLRNYQILPSGPLPPNSAELLRSREMGTVLEQLRREHDFVILDAPPLLPVADSQVLLDHPQVDACLIVARAYRTTRQEARRARAILDRFPLERIGLVVNGLRELDAGYDYYGSAGDDPPSPREGRQEPAPVPAGGDDRST